MPTFINLSDPLAGLYIDRFTDRRHLWLVFRATNIYRLVLASLLLAAFALDEQSRLFGKQDPRLFLGAALAYLILAIIAIAGSYWRWPRLFIQAHGQMLVDLIVLTVIINASGGLSSSLNSLLIAAVAANGILLPMISALLAAAMGFFLLISSWLVDRWHYAELLARQERGPGGWEGFWTQLNNTTDDWVRLGVLGAVLFAAAGLTHALAERARRGEALARQRTWELLEIAELNQGIIRHLQNGVVVVDAMHQIQLINDTAREWLGALDAVPGSGLEQVSPPLAYGLKRWLCEGSVEVFPFRPAEHRPELIPRFTRLSGRQAANVLILLEDSDQTAMQLQQIKLAALGRLTAGIAHEIRNPLTAISHAAQLLEESASASASTSDQRLAQIVHDNVKRANRIISDVLDLARRERVKPERLELAPWLELFREEFLRGLDHPAPEWRQSVESADLAILFDPHQLRQVLWNLCANACQHGVQSGATAYLELHAGRESSYERPFLEVRDAGPGIPPENVSHLFEPFFTTRARGTGLGLYLARELCEANRAQLQYVPVAKSGSCFRITFVHPSPVSEMD
ncbi:MAG: two-component system, NtrC family, sensor histidine kinase PilS [Pseudomonadota bacterium]|nr:two-component system, NtrC family, sensor histidine kinase PilS [Pseudomonadota bacterium]